MFGAYSATIGADAVPVIGTYLEPVGHWLIGSGHTGLLAWGPPALSGKSLDVGVMAFFLYMVAFMDTTATIPTGAMAERWKWKSFCMWSIFCGAIYYPLFGAMTWGGGWLAQLGNSHGLGLGYVDFAGSGVVHAMGGVAALAGAMVLGPRLGKFGPDGKARTIADGHARHVHPAVWLVRVQRGIHVRRYRSSAGCRSREHCDCCGVRSDHGHGMGDAQEEG